MSQPKKTYPFNKQRAWTVFRWMYRWDDCGYLEDKHTELKTLKKYPRYFTNFCEACNTSTPRLHYYVEDDNPWNYSEFYICCECLPYIFNKNLNKRMRDYAFKVTSGLYNEEDYEYEAA